MLPGRSALIEGSRCTTQAQGLLAECRIGKGRVVALADAALLEMREDNAGQVALRLSGRCWIAFTPDFRDQAPWRGNSGEGQDLANFRDILTKSHANARCLQLSNTACGARKSAKFPRFRTNYTTFALFLP